MPGALMVQSANMALTAEAVETLQREQSDVVERLSVRGSLSEVAQSHLGLSDEDRRYLDSIPSSVQEALRAAIHDAVGNGRAVQISFRPAYDFGVCVWEFGRAVGSQLKGPDTGAAYPRESFSA